MAKRVIRDEWDRDLTKLEDEELTALMLRAKTAGRDTLVGQCQIEEGRRKAAAEK